MGVLTVVMAIFSSLPRKLGHEESYLGRSPVGTSSRYSSNTPSLSRSSVSASLTDT